MVGGSAYTPCVIRFLMTLLLTTAGAGLMSTSAALFQKQETRPSPGRGGAAPAWKRIVKLSDGRTFITDGGMTLDVALARPDAIPHEVLGAATAKVVEGYLAAPLPHEIDLRQLRAAPASPHYVAPNGVQLNAGYVDYLRRALPPARVRLRMKGDLEPVVILLDGTAVGLVMPMRQVQ